MSKKSKIILCVIGIFLVTSILIGISYAYYIFSVSQSGSNVVRTDCFEITFSDGNDINLSNAIPLSEDDAKELTPYTFTIKNVCNSNMFYNVNIESLETSSLDLNFLRYKLDNKDSNLLGNISNNDSSLIVNTNVSSSKTVYSGLIAPNMSKTHELKFWIDIDSTVEQSSEKLFESKVVVIAHHKPENESSILVAGEEFNRILKTLSVGQSQISASSNSAITSIQRSLTAPQDSDNSVIVSIGGSEKPIYAWFKNGIIYLYTSSDKIMLNPDSSYQFLRFNGITNLDMTIFDSTYVVDLSGIFSSMDNLQTIDLSGFDTSSVTDMSSMFYNDKKLLSLDISSFNTSNVTDMSSMFNSLNNLESLNLSHFDTSNVMDMSYMFYGLNKITSLDLSNFDTSKVTEINAMFARMSSLSSLNISSFDTSNVVDMNLMFSGLNSITDLDVSHFNTSNVTDMSGMFYNMSNITSLDLSHFDTSKVMNMSNMFLGMTNLVNLDISSFDTSNVTNMEGIFNESKSIKDLDISSFDTSKVTNFRFMFYKMDELETIYVSNKWSMVNAEETLRVSMFNDSVKIVGGAGTTYDENHTDYEYARVDDPTNGKPGYFTLKTT